MATHRIIVRSDTAKKLNLYTAAATVASIPLMDLPVLLSDKALQGSEKDLAKSAQSSLEAGMYPTLEFIPMPKLGYGNRPLASLGPETRVVLTSIVNALEDSLPKSSRQGGFSNFEKFGTESDDSWLVDFDIAACYEYIDHNILDDELIRQGADADIVRLTSELLHSMLARPIGLPQGLDPSHRLSDAYLDRIQRNLLRHGYSGTRFADDFRMVVQSPEEAHKLISLSIEEARSVHLTLAEQKIRVRRSKDVVAELVNRTSVFEDYVEKMIDELTEEITQKVDYDDFETEYVVPDEDVVNFAALEELLEDWGDKDRASSRALAHAGTFALRQAQEIKHDIKPLAALQE
ncbi:RNA-directed DNA polymerase [Glutamicibacter arilaitensis]|uniref:RNA-directed DNA polymerase n=1 Tax=Glutamicibacter arilaitensis TaxID=256701 RepID=UPI0002F6D90F|nr:RNA-directed DNA polymerase [Glutamicibacter arilaitensis]